MKIKVFHSETQAEIKEVNLIHQIREGESCFIGRSQNSGLSLDSPSISRLHGKFTRQDGQYYFCDLGSSNGSIIQGEIMEVNREYLLHPGDVIRLGDFVLLLEATPEPPEELPQTVIGSVDATVVTRYASSSTEWSLDSISDNNEEKLVIEAELVKDESLALVKLKDIETDHNLQHQTRALFTAINHRILAELKAAGNLTRDTYLKAIRNAQQSIEQERLIDPDHFEKEAEKYWQSIAKNTSELGNQLGAVVTKGASNLGQRLGAAAKAAWHGFLSYQPGIVQKSDEPISEISLDLSGSSDSSFDDPSDNLSDSSPSDPSDNLSNHPSAHLSKRDSEVEPDLQD